MDLNQNIRKVAFLGDYVPRRCGIATFTSDLCEAVAGRFSELNCFAVPVNDCENGYDYPERVRFEIAEKDIESYHRAADFLNLNNVDVVCLQHEYGIYGGDTGIYILTLMRDLHMPIVTTLHTVLQKPSPSQHKILVRAAQMSTRVVVMTKKALEFLTEIYRVPAEKIDLIPHGIPDMPFVDPNFYKDQFGVEGKIVLLTFGLLSPDKGIEYVIKALPRVLQKHPNVVYIVVGATHPKLLEQDGESYRLSLERLAEINGVDRNVIFFNQFVTIEQLKEFIGVADIYLTPYLNEARITSGTLAYSFGAGKVVISTPYWHATELLAENRGVLVPFRDSEAIADQILMLLENEVRLNSMRKNAFMMGREMIWPRVAELYMQSFEKAKSGKVQIPSKAFASRTLYNQPYQLPPLKLDQLFTMTDSTGILQHAMFNVPNFGEGYCTDDNARAFLLTILLEELGDRNLLPLGKLASTYLAFVSHAFDAKSGRFRNFLSFDRHWTEVIGSEDSHARAMWALGAAIGRSRNEGFRNLAVQLIEAALPAIYNFTSSRAYAFAMLAIHEYFRRLSGDRAVNQARDYLTDKLMGLYRATSANDWLWFEDSLTYDNAKLPHALILSGYWTSKPEVLETGLKALRWLVDIQKSSSGCFSPIGSNGFYKRGSERARFDQQPIEASATISACLEAYNITHDKNWFQEAERAFEWYLGRNDIGLPLYDSKTGGCCDALHADRINQNQGAESTLAFYLSLVEFKLAQGLMD